MFKKTTIVSALVVLLALQLALALRRPKPPDYLRSGEQISEIAPSSSGAWRVLMVFRSDCPHCNAVAPNWQKWLTSSRPFERILIASKADTAAVAFQNQHDLRASLVLLDTAPAMAQRLLSRVPWIFLVDSQDVIKWNGHGSNFATADSAFLYLKDVAQEGN